MPDDVTVTFHRRLQVPMVPNFIRDEYDQAIPVASLNENALREVARAWTTKLLKHAKRMRENK